MGKNRNMRGYYGTFLGFVLFQKLCANGPPTETFIVWDESSPLGPVDPASLMKLLRTGYIIDVDFSIEAHH